MSLRCCEWRVCGRGQTTSKPSIHKVLTYSLRHCSSSLRKNFWLMIFWQMKTQCLQHEGGWLFIPSYESICVGFWRFPKGSLSFQWSSLEDRGGGGDEGFPSSQFKIREWMEVEISSDVKFFKLYPRKREAGSWGSLRTFKFIKSQLTTEIFLAPDLMGGIHSTLVTWVVNLSKCKLLGSRYLSWNPLFMFIFLIVIIVRTLREKRITKKIPKMGLLGI